jgi:hypothetical protein
LAATIRAVERLVAEEPDISANEVALRLRLRRATAGLILRGLRTADGSEKPFPNTGDRS